MRYVGYALIGFGLSFFVSIAFGKLIAAGNRRVQRYTVIWRNTKYDLCAYTGTLTHLDATHIVVEGKAGPTVIAKADIVEVLV